MKEQKIQYDIVIWFSQTYPNLYGHLFEVNNDTYNMNHAMKRRSMGMISGVSDLIFVIPKSAKIAAIELKAPGSRHDTSHILNQLNWGKKIIGNRGFYIMTPDENAVKNFIEHLIFGRPDAAFSIQEYWLKKIEDELKLNKKTIKF